MKEIEMNFCDMHSHILPALDDGSRDMEQTLRMLSIAEAEGITDIICTPHHHLGRYVAPYEECEKRIQEVREVIQEKGIHIGLHLGTELCYFGEAVEELIQKHIHTMVESEYVLVEFDPSVEYSYLRNAIGELRMAGYKPIIAHVERYGCMDLDRCEEIIEAGALLQVNASSILGDMGSGIKRFIKKLMRYEMVSYVGTDAHSDRHRAPRMSESFRYVSKKFGMEYALQIFEKNARALLQK